MEGLRRGCYWCSSPIAHGFPSRYCGPPCEAAAMKCQVKSQEKVMTEKRPMTDAEERLVEQCLKWRQDPPGVECERIRNMASWSDEVLLERAPPKPITPEERAVVEAAQGYIRRTCQSEFLALAEAVRRLPP